MAKATSEDYYAMLGVPENISVEELRRVWRRLAKRYHPDHAGQQSTASFQRLLAAYEVLCDPLARATYDRQRFADMPRASAPTPTKPTVDRKQAPSIMLSRLSGPIMALFACGAAQEDENGDIELFVSAAEARQGGMVTISMRVDVHCKKCPPDRHTCRHCGGNGTTDELFSAWLAVPPEVTDGSVLSPSEWLPGMVHPVRFIIRTRRC